MPVTVSVVVPADPASVWSLLADIPNWPRWNPACVSASVDGDLLTQGARLRLLLLTPRGRKFYTAPVVTDVRAGELLAFSANSLGIRAPTRITLAPHDEGTAVVLTADSRGPLAFTYRLAFPERTQGQVWSGALTGLVRYLRAARDADDGTDGEAGVSDAGGAVPAAPNDQLREQLGPYAAVFEPIPESRTPYLELLNFSGDHGALVIEMLRSATGADADGTYLAALFADVDWRPHLVGAVAMYLRPRAELMDRLWRTVDGGTWVSPQAAAVASVVDPLFVQQAADRLAQLCPVQPDPHLLARPLPEQHSLQGPGDSVRRSAKTAAALHALLRADHPDHPAVAQVEGSPEFLALVGEDQDRSAQRAIEWRSDLRGLAEPGSI